MKAQEALSAITILCEKVCRMIDLNDAKLAEIDKRVAALEKSHPVMLNVSQVAKATGWSIAAVAKWMETGFIESTKIDGLKKALIPSTEIEKIIKTRGYGKKHLEGR